MHKRFDASEDLLNSEEIQILRESFEDGDAAEKVDFILDQYISLDSLYEQFKELSSFSGFWEDIPNVHFLAIKLFYKFVNRFTELDINKDIDNSVIYWANRVSPILSKIIADRTPQS